MKILRQELKKIWTQPFVRVFLVLIILISSGVWYVNFSTTQNAKYDFTYYHELMNETSRSEVATHYEKLLLYSDYEQYVRLMGIIDQEPQDIFLSPDFLIEYETYVASHDLNVELSMYADLNTYLTDLSAYPKYLQDTKQRITDLQAQPYWKGFSQSRKNYYESLYSMMEGLNDDVPLPANYFGVEIYLTTDLTIPLILTAFIMSWAGFKIEDESDMTSQLLLTKRGRHITTISKLCAITISTLGISLLIHFVLLFLTHFTIGLPSFMTQLQSIPSLYTLPYNLTLQMLWLKLIGLQVVGLITYIFIFSAFYYSFKTEVMSTTVSVLMVGVGFFFFYVIQEQMAVAFLRYMNPLLFLHSAQLNQTYRIVEIGKFGLSQINLLFMMAVILSFISLVTVFLKRLETLDRKVDFMFNFSRVSKLIFRRLKLFGFEVYKLLILRKGILVILALILTHGYFASKTLSLTKNFGDEKDLAAYYEVYGGTKDEDMDRWFSSQAEQYDAQLTELKTAASQYRNEEISYDTYIRIFDAYHNTSTQRNHFNQLYSHYSQSMADRLIYPKGYQALFSLESEARDFRNTLIIIVGSILLLSPIFSQDNEDNMNDIPILTKYGGPYQSKVKIGVSFTIVIIYIIGIFMTEYAIYHHVYPMNNWSATIQDVIPVNGFVSNYQMLNVPLWGYALLLVTTRIIGILVLASIIMFISKKIQSVIYSYIIAMGAVLGPILLHMTINKFFAYLSIDNLIMGNQFLLFDFNLIYLVGSILISVYFIYKVIKNP